MENDVSIVEYLRTFLLPSPNMEPELRYRWVKVPPPQPLSSSPPPRGWLIKRETEWGRREGVGQIFQEKKKRPVLESKGGNEAAYRAGEGTNESA
ncbi:hypothetical protein KM043_016159 [Ampulex compressa]|nr:hypothetical protein KM043_016159 [Ampulex compressa]